jgi:hypothetical protein
VSYKGSSVNQGLLFIRKGPKNDAVNDAGGIPEHPVKRSPDHALLARMVLREGKSFTESALAAGYSATVAARGLKVLATKTKCVSDALARESEHLLKEQTKAITLDKLKPLAIIRLHAEITNPKSSNGMKAIELAGRFKETDWFVRNADVSLGVFMALGEQAPDPAAEVIDSYVEPEKSST